MLVVDELTGKTTDSRYCKKAIVSVSSDGTIRTGYVKDGSKCVKGLLYSADGKSFSWDILLEKTKDNVFYSNKQGLYIVRTPFISPDFEVIEVNTKGIGRYPYSFGRRYEAIENFNIFKGKQRVNEYCKTNLSKYLKYTIGLEFETSAGLIPEHLCFRDGLIPLRDGSISGLEYSTVVLQGETGINLLKQQLKTLREYTIFNKECSLHIHFGGYPLDKDAIFRLYQVCFDLQSNGELQRLLPPLTFNTSKYKSSGKDYCRNLNPYDSFEDLYYSLVGERFFGRFDQPHPADLDRDRKWNIATRYYWINFINMLCYKVNKTVEFRFLRPTYNLKKILVWIYIMNAILIFSEKEVNNKKKGMISLRDIFHVVYDEELAKKLCLELIKLELLVNGQIRNSSDKIGADLSLENSLFPEDDLI